MKVEGSERLALPRGEVWRRLQDPVVLERCTPGLTHLEESAPGRYDAVLELQLATLKGRFAGSVEYVARHAPEQMTLKLAGKGAPGFVDGEAVLILEQAGEETLVRYQADVQVGGQVARLGQRMISGVTKQMAGQFFEALARTPDAEAAGVSPAPVSVRQSFLVLFWRSLLGFLGLSRRS